MNKKEIAQRLKELAFDKAEYWLIAGGAMVWHGVREEAGDIDLGCSRKMADSLENQGVPVTRLADGTRKIVPAPDVEIFEEWLYDRVELVDGYPVISLPGLLEMKRRLGREKDMADIRLLEALLGQKSLGPSSISG